MSYADYVTRVMALHSGAATQNANDSLLFMTQRDNAAMVEWQDSSDADEPSSAAKHVTDEFRPIEPPAAASSSELPGIGLSVAAVHGTLDQGAAPEAQAVDRPTLLGLAPVEPDVSGVVSTGELQRECEAQDQKDAAEVEELAPSPEEIALLDPELLRVTKPLPKREAEFAAAAALTEAESPADEEEPSELIATGKHDAEAAAQALAAEAEREVGATADARLRKSTIGTFVGRIPAPEQPERADQTDQDDGESEWSDLSTRWVIASGNQAEDDLIDDNEVTNDLHWGDRLAAVMPRSAAVQPLAAEQSSRRHATLTGMSPLDEDPGSQLFVEPVQPASVDAVRASRPEEPPQPWNEEPSYSDARRPTGRLPSWTPTAQVGTVPPWAAMPSYAQQPSAAVSQSYAPQTWNTAPVTPPPWAATSQQLQYLHPSAYAPGERRPSTRIDFPTPRRMPTGMGMHPPQPHVSDVITLEQLKHIADGWLGAIGKLAIAGMALHYSGLAVPLLAQFGYAPTPTLTPAGQVGASAIAAPAAATLAPPLMPSVMPEPAAPVLAAPYPDVSMRRYERESDVAAVPYGLEDSTRRRVYTRRDAVEPAARRRSVRLTHGYRSRRTKGSHTADSAEAEPATQPTASAAELPAKQPIAAAAAPEPAPAQPLPAAAPEAEDAVGEAFLRINTRPWSQVFIDGTQVGTTPKIDLRVSAGSHRIRMVNTQLGLSKTVQVRPIAGETVSLVETLDD